jgi:hypothetical protein
VAGGFPVCGDLSVPLVRQPNRQHRFSYQEIPQSGSRVVQPSMDDAAAKPEADSQVNGVDRVLGLLVDEGGGKVDVNPLEPWTVPLCGCE